MRSLTSIESFQLNDFFFNDQHKVAYRSNARAGDFEFWRRRALDRSTDEASDVIDRSSEPLRERLSTNGRYFATSDPSLFGGLLRFKQRLINCRPISKKFYTGTITLQISHTLI